jgi:hypothetical protein
MNYWQRAIKLPIKPIITGLILLQILAVCPSFAQNFIFDRKQKKEAMYFKFVKNLIVIPLYINEKGLLILF